jgi:ribosomal protein S6
VVTFTAEPAAQGELDRTLHLADEVLRYKTTIRPPQKQDKKERDKDRSDRPEDRQEEEAAPQPEASPAAVGGATPQGE